MQKLPWLDYSGQTTPELIACKDTHRIDSLLCAVEEGIQNKLARGTSISGSERVVLAVMALQREVNNGGHRQFFLNSSREYAPIIGDCLRRTGCESTAEIVADAINALGVSLPSPEAVSAAARRENAGRENTRRDRILHDCDRRFYRTHEIEPNLFHFIETHQDEIQLAQASVPRPQKKTSAFPNVSRLYAQLLCSKQREYCLESARQLAEDLAQQHSIPAADYELEGAAVLYSLHCSLQAEDLDACEPLALLAFDLARDHTMQGVLHRDWINQLIAASQDELADAATLAYLEYLKSSDPSSRATQNRIKLWAAPVREHAAVLPDSVGFFAANFPGVGLERCADSN